jgi:PAS domain S-box-containing protein
MENLKLERLLADKSNLERILDHLMEGIIAHDRARKILFFNRSAEKITGYRKEEVLGRDCHEAFGEPFCGARCSFCEDPGAQWKDVSYSLHFVTREGDHKRLEMAVTGMRDEAGRLVGAIAAFRDVTDLIGLKLQVGSITSYNGITGKDPAMQRVFQQIREMAANDYPVHIMGETGTGKELVAAAIHQESRRGGGPFVPVNCGALPEGILESELFGHVRGAFSGAFRDKKGRFELAHGGTLFLDEVADLPKSVQVRLLRVLQEGVFERVGDEKSLSVNVRIISATNRDLKKEVRARNFREDLYYRINVVPIHIPPLRQRRGDIPLLTTHFLEQAAVEVPRTAGISDDALALMMDYPWPGNVRELQSAVRFAVVHCSKGKILPSDLPLELRDWQGGRKARGPVPKLTLERVRTALVRAGGNKAKAARSLGVGRATLYRFLGEHPDAALVSQGL